MIVAWQPGFVLLAQGGIETLLPAILMIAVLFYFVMYLPQKKQQQSRRRMLENLKKNDHVVTIGGIHGTVVALRKDSEQVTLRLDESSNTRVDFDLNAVQRVVQQDSGGEQST